MILTHFIRKLFNVAFYAFTYAAVASPIIPLPIDRLANEADLILHGSVSGLAVQRDAEGRIYTKVTLQVTDPWKGEPSADPFTVVHSGGILGKEWSITDGEVSFKMGEEVVVFLVLNSRGEGVTIGMNQGKFAVQRTTESRDAYVRSLFHGGEAPKPGDKKGYRLPTQLPLTLESLKRRVTRNHP